MPSNAILFKTYTEGLSSDEKLQFQSEFTSRQRTSGLGIVLALLLGGLGAHKFYLKDTTAGIVYALCGTIGWVIIVPPFVIAILSIIDACHSGTSLDLPYIYRVESGIEDHGNDLDCLEVCKISGCRDSQTSADAYINNKYQGALTFTFIKI